MKRIRNPFKKKPTNVSDWHMAQQFDYTELDYDDRLDWFLLLNRTVVFHGEVEEDVCYTKARELQLLGRWSHDPIRIILNSVGGSVHDGLIVVETIGDLIDEGIKVNIEVRGVAYSMGLDILLAGSHRSARPYSRFLLHEMITGDWAAEKNIHVAKERMKESEDIDKMLAIRISNRCDLSLKEIKRMMHRKDIFFGVKKAFEWGMIHEIVGIKELEEVTWE